MMAPESMPAGAMADVLCVAVTVFFSRAVRLIRPTYLSRSCFFISKIAPSCDMVVFNLRSQAVLWVAEYSLGPVRGCG